MILDRLRRVFHTSGGNSAWLGASTSFASPLRCGWGVEWAKMGSFRRICYEA